MTIPFSDYQSMPGLNASSIKHGRLSLAHMRHYLRNGMEDKASFAWGRLVHLAVLEPLRMLEGAALWEGERKAGPQWKEWQTANPGKDQVTRQQIEDLTEISTNVKASTDCAHILAMCECEKSITWQGAGYGLGKARMDAVSTKAIIDVKTCSDISERGIDRSIFQYGYDLQMGWYEEGCERTAINMRPDLFFIFIESAAPFSVCVCQLGYDVIERGRAQAVDIATRYRAAETSGVFPGPSAGVRVVSLPIWLQDEAAGTDISTGVVNG